MYLKTIYLGIILILLGLVSYFGAGGESVTALIPSFFGILFVILGLLARNEKIRKHIMHAALLLAVLGLAGTFGGLIKFFGLLAGAEAARPLAIYAQSLMAVLSIIYLGFGIKSFIDARKK